MKRKRTLKRIMENLAIPLCLLMTVIFALIVMEYMVIPRMQKEFPKQLAEEGLLEEEILTVRDLYSHKPLKAGHYICEWYEYADFTVYRKGRVVEAERWGWTLRHPVITKVDGKIYLYGMLGDDYSLLVRAELGGSCSLETLNSSDIPEGVKYCGSLRQQLAIGESENESGYYYAMYEDGKEVSGFQADSRLTFAYQPYSAIDEDGMVWMMYYSTEPYQIQAYPVEGLPEKADSKNEWGYDKDDGRVIFGESGERYLIKLKEEAGYMQNTGLWKETLPLKAAPEYVIVKDVEFNYINKGAGQQYFSYLDAEEEEVLSAINHEWLWQYLGDVVLEQFVEQSPMEIWDDKTAVEDAFNDFLESWKIQNKYRVLDVFLGNTELLSEYPEEAAKVGIGMNEEGCLDISTETLKEFLEFEKQYIPTYNHVNEDAFQEFVLLLFGDHPELIDAHPEIASKYGISEKSENFWAAYLEILSRGDDAYTWFEMNPEMRAEFPKLAEKYYFSDMEE